MTEEVFKKDLNNSMLMGSEYCYEFFCQPCNVDDNHIEAEYYCSNCEEYMCKRCSDSHKKFKQLGHHKVLDLQHMTDKPPLRIERAVTMATHVKADIKVKGIISSSTLMSTNKLLIADWDNSKVRIVDIGSGHQAEMKLSDQPWQVTRIGDTEAAVTLPYKRAILLLKTNPELSFVKEIGVRGECRGLAYIDNKLIVSFMEGRVKILDMSGKVLMTISSDNKGRALFTQPCYVAVDAASGTIFVSDWDDWRNPSRVVKLNMEGGVLATYSSEREGYPRQVAVDSQGLVYVVWRAGIGHAGCVEQLSSKCEKLRTILCNMSPLSQALSYDGATGQLYVGQENGVVEAYKLS